MQAGYPGQLMDVLNNFYAQSQSARISAEKNSEKYSTSTLKRDQKLTLRQVIPSAGT